MNLKTIGDKLSNGTKLIMVIPTILFRNKDVALIEARHIVSDYEQGRPDLIAAKYYGDVTALDIILKYNNISDPFSIIEGETIIIPIRDIPLQKFERPQVTDENPVKQQFIDTKRLSKKDQKRIETLQKKYGKAELLPPNVVPSGKKTYKFDKGNIVFGKQAQSADPVVEKVISEISKGTNN